MILANNTVRLIIMNFKLQNNVSLSELTTFKIGGRAKYFVKVTNKSQLPEIFMWLKDNDLEHIILSGGSNTIFDDGLYLGLVIKINIKGFKIVSSNQNETCISVGSGENWDRVVSRMIDMGLAGVEALSGIAGTTGAAPVQNIGAYGQELKDTLLSVGVFDTSTLALASLTTKDCKLKYRDSIFRSSQKGRYIITNVIFKLSKKPPTIPSYKDVINYFEKRSITNPSLTQIRSAVLEIRSKKFVDPSVAPNAGSFFKNPIVSRQKAEQLMLAYPNVKAYPDDTKIIPLNKNKYKIAAGWLIELLNIQPKDFEKVRIDPNHSLVLENVGGASQKDLNRLVGTIQQLAQNKFGIFLEPEVVTVKFKD